MLTTAAGNIVSSLVPTMTLGTSTGVPLIPAGRGRGPWMRRAGVDAQRIVRPSRRLPAASRLSAASRASTSSSASGGRKDRRVSRQARELRTCTKASGLAAKSMRQAWQAVPLTNFLASLRRRWTRAPCASRPRRVEKLAPHWPQPHCPAAST